MKIDLKQDLKKVEQDLATRVKNYGKSKKGILGKPGDPIRLITLGYSYDQSGWTVVVFDTRPNAEMDGEWQSCIANELEFEHWTQAIDDCCENESKLAITLHDGSRRDFTSDFEQEELAECFGLMCRAALERAWKKGLLSSLPLADDCKLVVEDHVGFYGWKNFERTGEIDQDAVKAALLAKAKKLPKPKRIEFWISELECLAAEKPCESAKLVYDSEFVVGELLKLGQEGAVAAVKWANRWALKPEFRNPETRKDGEDVEFPSSNVRFRVFRDLAESRIKSDELEKLARSYIERAMKVPPVPYPGAQRSASPKMLYGSVPFHAAFYLHDCYPGYPRPSRESSGNRLKNAEAFIGAKKPAAGSRRSK